MYIFIEVNFGEMKTLTTKSLTDDANDIEIPEEFFTIETQDFHTDSEIFDFIQTRDWLLTLSTSFSNWCMDEDNDRIHIDLICTIYYFIINLYYKEWKEMNVDSIPSTGSQLFKQCCDLIVRYNEEWNIYNLQIPL